jgi:hypothetical protein
MNSGWNPGSDTVSSRAARSPSSVRNRAMPGVAEDVGDEGTEDVGGTADASRGLTGILLARFSHARVFLAEPPQLLVGERPEDAHQQLLASPDPAVERHPVDRQFQGQCAHVDTLALEEQAPGTSERLVGARPPPSGGQKRLAIEHGAVEAGAERLGEVTHQAGTYRVPRPLCGGAGGHRRSCAA